jgi:hypothetical protein
MVLQGVVFIVNDVPVGGAVRMYVRNDMTPGMAFVKRVAVRIAVVVVTILSTCALRGGDKRALNRKCDRGRHHDDDSELSQERVRQTAQPWTSRQHCSSTKKVYIR